MSTRHLMKKCALITGCSRGIGLEIAKSLAYDGYDIIGTYNTNLIDIKKLKNKMDLMGVNFDYYKLDLSDDSSIYDFINNIKDRNIDVLVNNASLSLDCEFLEKSKEEFMKVLEVNLVGPFILIQKLIKNINKNGVIINISSTDGLNTYSKLNMDYSASKAGLINLTKSLSLELTQKIYCICPNWVNTESIREMNQDYLKEEMERVGQEKLIDPNIIALKVLELISSNLKSGSIIVME